MGLLPIPEDRGQRAEGRRQRAAGPPRPRLFLQDLLDPRDRVVDRLRRADAVGHRRDGRPCPTHSPARSEFKRDSSSRTPASLNWCRQVRVWIAARMRCGSLASSQNGASTSLRIGGKMRSPAKSSQCGQPLVIDGFISRAVVFKDGGNPALAGDFVRFLAEEGWLAHLGRRAAMSATRIDRHDDRLGEVRLLLPRFVQLTELGGVQTRTARRLLQERRHHRLAGGNVGEREAGPLQQAGPDVDVIGIPAHRKA